MTCKHLRTAYLDNDHFVISVNSDSEDSELKPGDIDEISKEHPHSFFVCDDFNDCPYGFKIISPVCWSTPPPEESLDTVMICTWCKSKTTYDSGKQNGWKVIGKKGTIEGICPDCQER